MPITDGNMAVARSLANKTGTLDRNINGLLAQQLYNVERLYNDVFTTLVSYLELYTTGAFTTYSDSLSEEVIIDLVASINNSDFVNDTTVLNNPTLYFDLQDKSTPLPSKYVGVANEIMDVIKQTLAERQRILTLQVENDKCKTYKEILEDPQKLNDYIKEVQRTSYLFTAKATYTQPIELKPWYEQYLIRYGPPGDGVFDSELLGNIIQELIALGEISEDTVIN
tara:strand:+ start:229 stop:903 length:675 start_codon:yes stop_codon:yes gene_type:complete